MNRVGPFRSSTLLQQLSRLEEVVRMEIQRLRERAASPGAVVRLGTQQASYVARPGDMIWRDCYASDVTIWLPPPIGLGGSKPIFCMRLGAAGQSMRLEPRAGLINEVTYRNLTTTRDWALCYCDGEGWWTAE